MSEMMIGTSSTPTRYKVRTPSGEHYVRCGADLLLNGMRNDLEAEGRCSVCEQVIQFQVVDRQVLKLIPETSLLHVVEVLMANGKSDMKCEGSPIFDKKGCLQAWLNRYHGRPGSIFKPQAFLDRMIALREPHLRQALLGYS